MPSGRNLDTRTCAASDVYRPETRISEQIVYAGSPKVNWRKEGLWNVFIVVAEDAQVNFLALFITQQAFSYIQFQQNSVSVKTNYGAILALSSRSTFKIH